MSIVEELVGLGRAFAKARLKPPTALLLATPEEGLRFMQLVRASPQYMNPGFVDPLNPMPVQMADGSVYMEVKVMGMAVRWPANRLATEDGVWRHV